MIKVGLFETAVEVKTYLVSSTCKSCNSGMTNTGFVYSCNPPMYKHRCDSCGHIENFHERYPKIVHEEIKENE